MFATRLKTTAQRNPPELSPREQFMQRLLRGEEVPLNGSTLPEVYATFARDNNLPESDARKLGDSRRYYLRFDTNDTVTATNR